jgi:hypothetical protein
LAIQQPTSGGLGTAENPYQIATPEDLDSIGIFIDDWDKCFIITADIDMSAYTGTQFNIIGNSTLKFTGIFDGDGHIIRNLTYTTTLATSCVGLFGYTYSATIKNLGLENVYISSAGSIIGGLVGGNAGTITNCYCTGSVRFLQSMHSQRNRGLYWRIGRTKSLRHHHRLL